MNQIKGVYSFTQSQVTKLVAMQDELNTYIHPEWKTQGFNWDLAIIDECLEIHGHLGWKWWKKDYAVGLHDGNLAQVKLEVIDILHFVVSSWIQSGDTRYLLENFNAAYVKHSTGYTVNNFLEFAGKRRADMYGECWIYLAHSVGLTEQEILETYTQKYVLNKFRQDHGYKTGEYVKEWVSPDDAMPYEDNECLAAIVADIKDYDEDTTDEIELYSRLEAMYNSRLNK